MAPTPADGVARRTLSVLVEDVPGVLAKVAGLFARRAFNIHSLAVGPSEIAGLSRITVVVDADARLLEQITKQLNKLINVIKIIELEPGNSVQREHLVIKVKADAAARLQVTQAVELFRAKIVDVSTDSLTVEATGAADKLDALLSVLEPFGVREIVRSGSLAISRGSKSMTEKISAEKSFK
ncbi:acetolactate synthase small subunit [Nesterenkonia sphaerica]|uniref:Acetolactate synthase small subunit n=1 Tax=Nesterenkonia sphaerica TaxID=1804988 RepID=A0A5R9AH16_9MICC|nr:acetolactate synthase small subunit [Nesterenkonia sphaerica]TLP77454.1 acetolactate synthase small subunit [Nesterenkonia sphaerica]